MATVLIVDDDQAIVRLVSLVLASKDLSVSKAYSGEEALAYLHNGHGRPDLILLDLSMPGMDGREFYREARSTGYEGPVIVCSAYGATAARNELGAEGAIEKPFDPDALLSTIREHVGVA